MRSSSFFTTLLGSSLVAALFVVGALPACSSSSFRGQQKSSKQNPKQDSPNEKDGNQNPVPTITPPTPVSPTPVPPAVEPIPVPPVPTPVTKPPIPIGKEGSVELRLVQFDSEAWYKNCVTVSLANFETTPARFCNKPTGQAPTTLSLKVAADACNIIRIQVETTFPIEGSCHLSGKSNWDCSYPGKVDRTRQTDITNDRRFFGVFDSYEFEDVISQPAFRPLFRPIPAAREPARLTVLEQGMRVFFEDLSDAELDGYLAGTVQDEPDNVKIDYDDAVLEIVGDKKLSFTVEGDNFYATGKGLPTPALGLQPPQCGQYAPVKK